MIQLSDLRRIAEAANNALSTTAGHEFCHAFSPAECLRLLDEIDLLQGDVALLRAAIIQRRDWGATTGSDRDLLDADDTKALAAT